MSSLPLKSGFGARPGSSDPSKWHSVLRGSILLARKTEEQSTKQLRDMQEELWILFLFTIYFGFIPLNNKTTTEAADPTHSLQGCIGPWHTYVASPRDVAR